MTSESVFAIIFSIFSWSDKSSSSTSFFNRYFVKKNSTIALANNKIELVSRKDFEAFLRSLIFLLFFLNYSSINL